ncbi:MAG TPA: RNA polymerase sigma factor [Woeseiaceae bacterium]|nr:RNA polymerase sigma factor [Woeseiaceae bacterium]
MARVTTRAFRSLVEPHLGALFRAAYRLTGNKSNAEDLVQETCVRAFLHVEELHASRPVKGWLMRVQYNLFVDGVRRQWRSPIRLDNGADPTARFPSPEATPEESTYRTQLEEQLQRAWLRVDKRHRALLALRAEGYNLTEIAEITGLAEDALNARLYRARASLARHLREERALEPGIRLEITK